MKTLRMLGTVVAAAALAATLLTSQPAAAAQPDGALRAGFAAAACPGTGQQVKTSTSATVYLIGPDYYLYAIPGDVYFRLWDSWQPIATYDNLFTECYFNSRLLSSAHLAKTPSNATVYIYDSSWGGYRAITYNAFVHYRFSWSKIEVRSSLFPVINYPWDN